MLFLLLLMVIISPDGQCEMDLMEAEPVKQGAYSAGSKRYWGPEVP